MPRHVSRSLVTLAVLATMAAGLTAIPPVAQAQNPLRWERTAPEPFARSAVTIADLTGDGRNDVVVGNLDGQVYAFDAGGSPLPGFPRPVVIGGRRSAVESTPAVADLDGNGTVHVVVGAGSLDRRDQHGGVAILDRQGGVRCTFQTRDKFNQWTGGGPDGYSNAVWNAPAIGDVTGNGFPEIVFGSFDHNIYVMDRHCRILGQWDNIDTVFSSPALVDITGDGRLDIVVGGDSSRDAIVPDSRAGGVIRALTWRSGGLHQLWVRTVDEGVVSSPAIGDVTGDGRSEIVVGTGIFYDNADSRRLFALDLRTGHDLPGWPRDLGGQTWASPALGDLTGNGRLDIVAATRAGRVIALRGDGSPIWNIDPCAGIAGCGGEIVSSPVVADLDGNGRYDVAVGNGAGLFVLDGATGSRRAFLGGFAEQSAPAVGDLGGAWALVAAGFTGTTGRVRAYGLPTPGRPPVWPMFGADARNAGVAPRCLPTGARAVSRISGTDRVATAIAISHSSYGNGAASAAVLTRADRYPDALAGTPLAVTEQGPLLLTAASGLDSRVADELRRVLPRGRTVHLLGGTSALGPAVESAVRAMGYTTVRYAGVDRYETATLVAERGLGDPPVLLLATGTNFPDGLAAGAAAPLADAAVVLTAGSRMAPATQSYLNRRADARLYAVGGDAARAAPTATGIVGTDRFDTAVRLAQRFAGNPPHVALASGTAFADALTGGAHAARQQAPLLLTWPRALPASTASYLRTQRASISAGSLYGGPRAVSEEVRTCAEAALDG